MPDAYQLQDTSSLASLLAYAPQARQAALDFSTLDSLTFSTLADASTQILAQKEQDADLRLSLSGKLRELERKLERAEDEKVQMLVQVDSCKRNEEVAKTQASLMKSQLASSETAKRQLYQDLARSRRENQALKAATRQAKVVQERSIARQRDRFADAAIQAARNGCSRLVVVPNVFSSKGNDSSKDSSTSLYRKQIAELEAQRSSTLSSNSAMRRLCTESINALSEATAALSGDGASRALQSDLFPQSKPLRKDYHLVAHPSSHPAVKALATAISANERALFVWEGERKDLKERAVSSTCATISGQEVGKEQQEQPAATSRPKATRIPIRSASGATGKPIIDFSDMEAREEVAAELRNLHARLLERESDLKRMEERLEERELEVEEARQRTEAAERREAEAILLAREGVARAMVKDASRLLDAGSDAIGCCEQEAEAVSWAERTTSSELSYILEPISAKSMARRSTGSQPSMFLEDPQLSSTTHDLTADDAIMTQDQGRERSEGLTSEHATSIEEVDKEQELISGDFAGTARPDLLPTVRNTTTEAASTSTMTHMEPRRSRNTSSVSPIAPLSPRRSSQQQQKQQQRPSKKPRLIEAETKSRSALTSRDVPNVQSLAAEATSSTAYPPASASVSALTPTPASSALDGKPKTADGPSALSDRGTGTAGNGKKRAANPSVLQAALERRRRNTAAAAAIVASGK